jgi:serine/threonine-protein kinase HipA
VSAASTPHHPRADLHELTSIREAHVFKGDRLAAMLRRSPSGVEFGYLSEYLAAGGPPVATTLPLTDVPTLSPAGAVPPYFAGLLPEGRRLSSLRRAVKTSADDDLSLLLAVGTDTVGDVTVLPVGGVPAEPQPLVVADRNFDQLSFSDLLDAAGVVDRVALAGVQDKMSTRVLSLPLQYAGRRYILKLDTPDTPHIVANEDYFIRLAAAARFPVVSASVVHDAAGRPGLLVERFDREAKPDGGTAALAVEDGAQALGIYPADKYAVSAESVVGRLADLCAARPVALRDLYRQLAYAWLTGNGDVHAKNLSIIKHDEEWRVSLAYDLPSTLPYRDTTMALSMLGKKTGVSRKKLLEFAAAVGLPPKVATRVLDEVLAATETALDWPATSPYAPETARDVLRSLRHRRRLVAGSD